MIFHNSLLFLNKKIEFVLSTHPTLTLATSRTDIVYLCPELRIKFKQNVAPKADVISVRGANERAYYQNKKRDFFFPAVLLLLRSLALNCIEGFETRRI